MSYVLIYKQTHLDDPGETGIFGRYDCMGRVRGWDFDCVIALLGSEVSWVGIGAEKIQWPGYSPQVQFRHFLPLLPTRHHPAGIIADVMAPRPRAAMRVNINAPLVIRATIRIILQLAIEAPRSPGGRSLGRCRAAANEARDAR